MTTLAMSNSDYNNDQLNSTQQKASSLSQRIRALEEAGITDRFIKKRIPAYAAAAAVVGNDLSEQIQTRNYQNGNSTKIYQNPTNFRDLNNNNSNNNQNHYTNMSINSVSSVQSNENSNKHRIYRSNSTESLENSDNTFHENPDIVREDRIASPVNYHHIIDELNEAKSKLKKVPEPQTSPLINAHFGEVIVDTKDYLNNSVQSIQSPNLQNTSFSRATSNLLAESLKKSATNNGNLTNASTSSINQIPISIPLNKSPKPQFSSSRSSTPGGGSGVTHNVHNHYHIENEPSHRGSRSSRSSRSSTPNGISGLISIMNDIHIHNHHQSEPRTKSLSNIFDSANNSNSVRNSVYNSSIRSDYHSENNSYSKHTSPRPYINPQSHISSLKNIVTEVFDHSKETQQNEDNSSIKSNVNSIHSASRYSANEEPVTNFRKSSAASSIAPAHPYQPFDSTSHRSSVNSRNYETTDKPYVSQYTARTTNLMSKNATSNQMTTSHNDLLNATPFRAPSYEQLDSSDHFYVNNSRPVSASYSTNSKKNNPSLYDEYLSNNHSYVNVNNRSSSLSSNNTVISNHQFGNDHKYTDESNQNNGRSHLLIFNSEYTRAMNQNFHTDHFCCHNCDKSLTGCRYILKDEQPHCIACYEELFANVCEECGNKIGTDSKDLSYKDKHWHEKCFFCHVCKLPLVDKPFGCKNDSLYCGDCYNQAFASRCDKCAQIFKPGMKKMEYKGQQFHENCFLCSSCNTAIGSKSFIPKDNKIFCVPCYEHHFATKCTKCNKVISQGGVTYKNMPFHRECFTCTNCQQSLAGQRFTSRDDHPYCSDCFGKLFAKKCYSCVKPITVDPSSLTPEELEAGIGGTKYISFEDRHWHNECFDCNKCHTSLVGRGFLTDAMDILCPDCGRN